MSQETQSPRVAIASTGVANVASVVAAFRRQGLEPELTADPRAFGEADLAVLPGVGTFGAAMQVMRSSGLAEAVAARFRADRPLLAICLGMQLFFGSSEESPGVPGLGLLRGQVERFKGGLPLPQLGWNRVEAGEPGLVQEGWAYFANSYRYAGRAEAMVPRYANYDEDFVAALESPSGRVLLCQFHPELSGPWGAGLLGRWITAALAAKEGK